MHLELKALDALHSLTVRRDGRDWTVGADGRSLDLSVLSVHNGEVDLTLDGRIVRAFVAADDGRRLVFIDGRVHEFSLVDEQHADLNDASGPAGPILIAEMPGTVVKVMAKVGDSVKAGTPLLIMEAMKMETEIIAGLGGRVSAVHVKAGDVVKQKAPLIDLQPDDD